MANWQNFLELTPEWDTLSKDLSSLAKIIADRLEEIKDLPNEEDINETRKQLVEEFRDLAKSKNPQLKDFDSLMEDLYNWGDNSLDGEWNGKKVCWINTL